MKYAVVIPIYRGEKTIQKVVDNCIIFFETNNLQFEILLIADNPIDESWQVIQALQQKNPTTFQAILLPKNVGQHQATLVGFRQTNADFIFTIDEDGQHHPADFLELINQQKIENADVVYGKIINKKHSILRNATSFFSKIVFKIIVPNFYWHYSSFRLIKNQTAQKIINSKSNYPFVDGLIFSNANKISSINVIHNVDETGYSSYSYTKLGQHFFKIVWHYNFITRQKK